MKNITIIIFGATGDLAKRKLISALYHLIARKKLDNFVIIGAAYEDVTAEHILERAREFMPNVDEEVWKSLLARTFYKKINFIIPEDFEALKNFIVADTCIGFLPKRSVVKELLTGDLVQLDIDKLSITRQFYFIQRHGDEGNGLSNAFIKFSKAHYNIK